MRYSTERPISMLMIVAPFRFESVTAAATEWPGREISAVTLSNRKGATIMSIEIGRSVEERIKAVQPVIEAILEEELAFNDLVTLVIDRGLRAVVDDVLRTVDQETLVASIQQMAEERPQFVYEFMAARLREGSKLREAAKRQLGFPIRSAEPKADLP